MNVKNFHHFSRNDQRERRYPFLVAIDLMLHFTLLIAAIVLTAIALTMTFDALWSSVVWRLIHRG